MKIIPISLIVFGVIVIVFPRIIAYLIGGFFIFIGLNILFFSRIVKKGTSNYVKFGDYKIFR